MEDEAGIVLDCDEAFTQMFGYTAEELIGKSVLGQIHPDDQARVVEGWLAMLSSRRVQQTRLRRKRKDGSWMWVDTTLHNYLNQPDRNYVLVENIDVSAEMAAQEALQSEGSCCVASSMGCRTGFCNSTPTETSSTTTHACWRSCTDRPTQVPCAPDRTELRQTPRPDALPSATTLLDDPSEEAAGGVRDGVRAGAR